MIARRVYSLGYEGGEGILKKRKLQLPPLDGHYMFIIYITYLCLTCFSAFDLTSAVSMVYGLTLRVIREFSNELGELFN